MLRVFAKNQKGGVQMKMRKTLVATALFPIILGFLVVAPVYAEVTFESWVGQWFKGSIKDKGVMVDDLGTEKAVDKIPTYGYVESWDGVSYNSVIIQFDDETGTWMDPVPYLVKVIGGTPLDYVSYGFIPPGFAPGVELFALILHCKGKEKNDELKSFSAKSVGGCVIYDLNLDGSMYFAANEALKFKGVPADKVPDEVKAKLQ
jgi:hypothetical protein